MGTRPGFGPVPGAPVAEEPVEVVRNHGDGTRSARVEPSSPKSGAGVETRLLPAGVDAERQVDGGAEGARRASGSPTNPMGGDRRRSGPDRGAEQEPRPRGSSATLSGAGGADATEHLEGQPETAKAEEGAGKPNDPLRRDRGGRAFVGNDEPTSRTLKVGWT
jgi:hypothetical protein